jgi:hypothetical protein
LDHAAKIADRDRVGKRRCVALAGVAHEQWQGSPQLPQAVDHHGFLSVSLHAR